MSSKKVNSVPITFPSELSPHPLLATKVRNSDIAFELVEQLKATGPKIVRIIEANGDGDPALLGALFKVLLPCRRRMLLLYVCFRDSARKWF